ncbi:MAG TPA: hypothetical protein VMT54_04765 [Candidatus Cybelea sp.]|nr:hypothetical protein [Candidatus Cybelea sp.]
MSFVGDLFHHPKPQIQPAPTRADAAEALQLREEEERKRRALMAGVTGTQLTGTGGVTNELIGTRMLTSGQ